MYSNALFVHDCCVFPRMNICAVEGLRSTRCECSLNKLEFEVAVS